MRNSRTEPDVVTQVSAISPAKSKRETSGAAIWLARKSCNNKSTGRKRMGLFSRRQWMSTGTEIENERSQCTLGFWRCLRRLFRCSRTGGGGQWGQNKSKGDWKGGMSFSDALPSRPIPGQPWMLHAGPFYFLPATTAAGRSFEHVQPCGFVARNTPLRGLRILWWAAMKNRAAPAFGAINGPPPHPGIPVGVSTSPCEHRIADGMPSSTVVCDKEGDPFCSLPESVV